MMDVTANYKNYTVPAWLRTWFNCDRCGAVRPLWPSPSASYEFVCAPCGNGENGAMVV